VAAQDWVVTVHHHLHHFAWVESQIIPSEMFNVIIVQCVCSHPQVFTFASSICKYFYALYNYFRREHSDNFLQSPWVCWMKLLEQCQRESRDHSMISHLYSTQMLPRLQFLNEDVTRVHKMVIIDDIKYRHVTLKQTSFCFKWL